MFDGIVAFGYAIRRRRPELRPLFGAAYDAVRWANHFRRHARRTINGITYELDLAEDIDSTIYFKGVFEPATAEVMTALVRPGDRVFDIGANMGWYTLLLARLVGAHGSVTAFEPITWARKKLARNLSLNPSITNVHTESFAISSITQQPSEVAIRASWQPFSDDPGVFKELVQFVSMDDYVNSNKVSRLDLVKIDVDGFEARVIAGGARTLSCLRPVLVLEIANEAVAAKGDRLEDLVKTLYELEYRIYDESTRTCLPSYSELAERIPTQSSINVVCAHSSNDRVQQWSAAASKVLSTG